MVSQLTSSIIEPRDQNILQLSPNAVYSAYTAHQLTVELISQIQSDYVQNLIHL